MARESEVPESLVLSAEDRERTSKLFVLLKRGLLEEDESKRVAGLLLFMEDKNSDLREKILWNTAELRKVLISATKHSLLVHLLQQHSSRVESDQSLFQLGLALANYLSRDFATCHSLVRHKSCVVATLIDVLFTARKKTRVQVTDDCSQTSATLKPVSVESVTEHLEAVKLSDASIVEEATIECDAEHESDKVSSIGSVKTDAFDGSKDNIPKTKGEEMEQRQKVEDCIFLVLSRLSYSVSMTAPLCDRLLQQCLVPMNVELESETAVSHHLADAFCRTLYSLTDSFAVLSADSCSLLLSVLNRFSFANCKPETTEETATDGSKSGSDLPKKGKKKSKKTKVKKKRAKVESSHSNWRMEDASDFWLSLVSVLHTMLLSLASVRSCAVEFSKQTELSQTSDPTADGTTDKKRKDSTRVILDQNEDGDERERESSAVEGKLIGGELMADETSGGKHSGDEFEGDNLQRLFALVVENVFVPFQCGTKQTLRTEHRSHLCALLEAVLSVVPAIDLVTYRPKAAAFETANSWWALLMFRVCNEVRVQFETVPLAPLISDKKCHGEEKSDASVDATHGEEKSDAIAEGSAAESGPQKAELKTYADLCLCYLSCVEAMLSSDCLTVAAQSGDKRLAADSYEVIKHLKEAVTAMYYFLGEYSVIAKDFGRMEPLLDGVKWTICRVLCGYLLQDESSDMQPFVDTFLGEDVGSLFVDDAHCLKYLSAVLSRGLLEAEEMTEMSFGKKSGGSFFEVKSEECEEESSEDESEGEESESDKMKREAERKRRGTLLKMAERCGELKVALRCTERISQCETLFEATDEILLVCDCLQSAASRQKSLECIAPKWEWLWRAICSNSANLELVSPLLCAFLRLVHFSSTSDMKTSIKSVLSQRGKDLEKLQQLIGNCQSEMHHWFDQIQLLAFKCGLEGAGANDHFIL